MPATPAATPKQKAGAPTLAPPTPAQTSPAGENETVRLHITPFTPALLKVYLAPSILPAAKNISYHSVETFPEKGFGYVELPAMEAQKLRKKLNGSTLKGSKVRIEVAKPEKRKKLEVEHAEEEANEETERPAKKAKKDRKKKEGVLEGVELPGDRKVKRGWTEVPTKGKKERKDKKERSKEEKKKDKAARKESKYTKEPEVLFKAKLTPVAATEVARTEKKDQRKEKNEKNKSKREVVVHEFENNTKTPSFLKAAKVSTDGKAGLDYVDGKGWVDQSGNVVEAETSKAKNRRVLELVEPGVEEPKSKAKKHTSVSPSPKASPAPKSAKKQKKVKKVTPSPESSESESEVSSVVSSSSEDEDSDDEEEASAGASEPTSSIAATPTTETPAPEGRLKAKSNTPEIAITPSSPAKKEVHPLEALFKKPRPSPLLTSGSHPTSTPVKNLAPINTSFSFFGDGDADVEMGDGEAGAGAENAIPFTPQTQRDIEWRGLRSAAPTPDTAAIGRRFSFPWRKGSQEADNEDGDDDLDPEASTQLSNNTKANASASHLADVAEEDEDEGEGVPDAVAGAEQDAEEAEGEGKEEETEFRKWFWENQGNVNRAWKRRRKDAMKTKRNLANRRAIGGARRGA